MTVAQGIKKVLAYKKQTALGTPATGASGQTLRRRTSIFQATRDTFESDEIVTHQQSTGIGYGLKKVTGKISGLLSPGTYSMLIGSALRKDFAATTALTGLSLTIAGSGPYTITRGAGDFLADGIKVGDVVRLTAGSFDASNLNKNLLVTGVTATVLTVVVLNASALVAEGPIASSTVTVPGKKSVAPLTAHTNDYYSFEEWYSDLSKSETFNDVQVGNIALGLPATGNATVDIDLVGLSRVLGTSQVLTSPTAETTTSVLTAVQGMVLINGSAVTNITGAQLTINPNVKPGDAVVGSNSSADVVRGRISVTGQFTAMFDGTTIQAIYDAATSTSLVFVLTADASAAADFVVISLGAIKFTGDAPDDGEKQIIRTYPFTAQLNGNGGTALAWDKTIISVQDSAA